MKPTLGNLAIAAMSIGFVCLVAERAFAQDTGLIHPLEMAVVAHQ
jgi:hypothetical protein